MITTCSFLLNALTPLRQVREAVYIRRDWGVTNSQCYDTQCFHPLREIPFSCKNHAQLFSILR